MLPVPNFTNSPAPCLKKQKTENHPFDELDADTIKHFKGESSKTHIIFNRTLFYLGRPYPLIKCGSGVFHKVFAFRDQKVIKFKGKKLKTSEIVVKLYKPDPKLAKVIQADIEAYDVLKNKGVPLPICYLRSEVGEATPMWIVQKMVKPITGDSWAKGQTYDQLLKTDQRVIQFAKKYLTLNAQGIAANTGEFIGDFNPKNVMLDAKGNPVVIDPTLPDSDKGNWRDNLDRNVNHWSRNNHHIEKILKEDFPDLPEIDDF
jgi:hypothetical protein